MNYMAVAESILESLSSF